MLYHFIIHYLKELTLIKIKNIIALK